MDPAALPSSDEDGGSATPTSRQAGYVAHASPNDVLLGRGTGPNEHSGNCNFRDEVESRKVAYHLAQSRSERDDIEDDVIRAIHERGGRFLKKMPQDQVPTSRIANIAITIYEVVLDHRTITDKIKQAFRYSKGKDDAKKDPQSEITVAAAQTSLQSLIQPGRSDFPQARLQSSAASEHVAIKGEDGTVTKPVASGIDGRIASTISMLFPPMSPSRHVLSASGINNAPILAPHQLGGGSNMPSSLHSNNLVSLLPLLLSQQPRRNTGTTSTSQLPTANLILGGGLSSATIASILSESKGTLAGFSPQSQHQRRLGEEGIWQFLSQLVGTQRSQMASATNAPQHPSTNIDPQEALLQALLQQHHSHTPTRTLETPVTQILPVQQEVQSVLPFLVQQLEDQQQQAAQRLQQSQGAAVNTDILQFLSQQQQHPLSRNDQEDLIAKALLLSRTARDGPVQQQDLLASAWALSGAATAAEAGGGAGLAAPVPAWNNSVAKSIARRPEHRQQQDRASRGDDGTTATDMSSQQGDAMTGLLGLAAKPSSASATDPEWSDVTEGARNEASGSEKPRAKKTRKAENTSTHHHSPISKPKKKYKKRRK